MRVIGPRKDEPEFERDPRKAYERAMALDRQLGPLLPAHPKGVFRGTHAFFNAMDDARAVEVAKRAAQAPKR